MVQAGSVVLDGLLAAMEARAVIPRLVRSDKLQQRSVVAVVAVVVEWCHRPRGLEARGARQEAQCGM